MWIGTMGDATNIQFTVKYVTIARVTPRHNTLMED